MRTRYKFQNLSRMESLVAQSTSRPGSIEFPRLSPDVLLSIFLNLTSEDIVIFRRICKEWLEVLDNNKPLWRNLEWIGKSTESIETAVEMFDQKSSSSLEVVSIEDNGNWYSEDLQQVIPVISRSRANLKSLSVLTYRPSDIIGSLLELANSSPNLEKLVLWQSSKEYKQFLPLTHLVNKRNGIDAGTSSSQLKVLWLSSTSDEDLDIKQIVQLPAQFVNSLISFALSGVNNFRNLRPFLAKFAECIVHLSLSIKGGGSETFQPLFCPNLRSLDGNFQPDVSLYFDCPNLKHRILWLEPGSESGLQAIPSSVEQLWLKSSGKKPFSYHYGPDPVLRYWEPLSSSCPKMKILSLDKFERGEDRKFSPEGLIRVLEKRQWKINKGKKIQGLQVDPLQKLVLSLDLLSRDQLKRARKVAAEVIDIQDYTNSIELEY